MRKALLTLTLLLSLPVLASAQSWQFDSVFPDSTFNSGGNGVHGVAVDPDGKVWVQPYNGALVTTTLEDTIAIGTAKFKERGLQAIYVFNPDGTQADFSPLTFLSKDGAVVDTLGLRYVGPVDIGGNSYPQFVVNTGHGLRVSPADGNIYASQGDAVFRLDYKTGELLNTVRPYADGASLTAVAVDGAGNVYTASVVGADNRPIKQYSADLVEISGALITGKTGIARTFEVARDGNTIYWTPYTLHAVHMYRREDDLQDFPLVPDTVIRGVDSESITIHPVTGHLWLSGGSRNDMPNRDTTVATSFQPQTWYAFDQASLSKETPNPAILDSLKWTSPDPMDGGRPRSLAFSPDGNTAYISLFSLTNGIVAVQKLVYQEGSAVEPTGEIADGFTLGGNHPNPVSGRTSFEFSIPATAHATLKVYDTLGREVATVVDEMLVADTYRADFDASALSAGLYLYRLSAGGRTLNGTMTVVR